MLPGRSFRSLLGQPAVQATVLTMLCSSVRSSHHWIRQLL
jgi:hypothetical protein